MAITDQDFEAWLDYFNNNPERIEKLLKRILFNKYYGIPIPFDNQRQIENRIGELAEAQVRTEKTLAELAEHTDKRFEELAQAQARTEQRVGELAVAQTHTEQRVDKLVEAIASLAKSTQINFNRVDGRLGNIEGMLLEDRYRQRPASYFGRIVRKASVLSNTEIANMLEGKLTPDEIDEVLWIDIVLHGTPQTLEIPEVWLAVEVSNVLDESDIERAEARAALLRKAGYPTIAVGAGDQITEAAKKTAEERKVVVLQDGSVFNLDAAVA